MTQTPEQKKAVSANNAKVQAEQARLAEKRNAAASRAKVQAGQDKPAPVVWTPDLLSALLADPKRMAELSSDVLVQAIQSLAAMQAQGKSAKKPRETNVVTASNNVTHQYDEKTGLLTLVIDMSADVIDPETGTVKLGPPDKNTGKPKTSAVANFQGRFTDVNGREVGIGMNVYHKLDK